MKSDYEIVIIGAGVCGLAKMRALFEKGIHSILISEKEENFYLGDSPGLTSSIAIGEDVAKMIQNV
jgi:cation diffusion facilitator CzcD-associated flavoprotein CzcO